MTWWAVEVLLRWTLWPIWRLMGRLALSVAVKLLRAGPIPRHVHVVMDGNRRWAHARNEGPIVGHREGSRRLAEWAGHVGVRVISVYAFSVHNYSRNPQEREDLMELARLKFDEFSRRRDLAEHGISLRVVGDFDDERVDTEVVRAAMNLTETTAGRRCAPLVPVMGEYEMRRAVRMMASGRGLEGGNESDSAEEGVSPIELVSRLDGEMLLPEMDGPSLMLRTSGERRLSDFLLWQSSFALLVFMPDLWPDFNAWHFLSALWQYQRHYPALQASYDRYVEKMRSVRGERGTSVGPY